MVSYYNKNIAECPLFLVFDEVFVSLIHLILLEYFICFRFLLLEMEGSCFFLWRCCISNDAMAHYRYDH